MPTRLSGGALDAVAGDAIRAKIGGLAVARARMAPPTPPPRFPSLQDLGDFQSRTKFTLLGSVVQEPDAGDQRIARPNAIAPNLHQLGSSGFLQRTAAMGG